jgi:hypothetical protein
MSTDVDSAQQASLETDFTDRAREYDGPDDRFRIADLDEAESLRPINWNLLTADEAMSEWTDLDAWVDWLRRTYGLPPTVVPPSPRYPSGTRS